MRHEDSNTRSGNTLGYNTNGTGPTASDSQESQGPIQLRPTFPHSSDTIVPRPYISMLKRWKCQDLCMCNCHTRRVYTSRTKAKVWGYVFIGYTGAQPLNLFLGKCDDKLCHRQSPACLDFSYYLPLWFSSFAVRVTAGRTQIGNPSFGLFIRRRINQSQAFGQFTKVLSGDTEGLFSLLIDKKVHPQDALNLRGLTMLHVSELSVAFIPCICSCCSSPPSAVYVLKPLRYF